MGVDPHGGDSESVTGPRDEQMAESQPNVGQGERLSTQNVEASQGYVKLDTTRRSRSPQSRQRDVPSAAPSRIPTRASTMKRRSPTPTRTRGSAILSDEASAALQRTEKLQQSTHLQTQVASAQADAAMEAAKKAVLETAAVRRTVEAALAAQFQHQTALTTDQVAHLAKETSQQWQCAVQDSQMLNQRLQEQQRETDRLKEELQRLQVSQSAELQGLHQQRQQE